MKKIMLGLVMVMMLTMVGCGNGNATNNPSDTNSDKVVVDGNTGDKVVIQTETHTTKEITIFAEVTEISEKTIFNDNNEAIGVEDVVVFTYINDYDEVCGFGKVGDYHELSVGSVVKFVFLAGEHNTIDYENHLTWEIVE